MTTARFSLHAARTPQRCEHCGIPIPAGGEYWQVKGGPSGIARRLCVLCHVLNDLPTDGWANPPDGREVLAASVPHRAGEATR